MAAIQFFDACALFGPWPQHEDLKIADVLKVMAANKIERALALCTTGITYDYRAGNEATLEACAEHSDKLMPVATLDPRAYPACLDEAEKCAERGFKMIRFFPARQGWPIRYAPFRELLQKCDELHIPVAVECTHAGEATELADAVAFTQAPLLLAGVDSANIGEAIAVLRSSTKFYLETTALLAPGALEAVAGSVPDGAERLIYASYSPLRFTAASLNVVRGAGVPNEAKAAIVGGNLSRLVGEN